MKRLLITFVFISVVANASDLTSEKYIINSDIQILLPNGDIKAIGHVHAVSGDMIIDAGEAIYHQNPHGNNYITATGSPIQYSGKTEGGKPFTGRSKKLKYTPATGEVLLTDDAFVQQDRNTITADLITYNAITKKIIASATEGKRVKSIIYQNKVSQTGK